MTTPKLIRNYFKNDTFSMKLLNTKESFSNKTKDYSSELPRDLVMDIANMTSNNSISKPLRTMPSLGPTG